MSDSMFLGHPQERSGAIRLHDFGGCIFNRMNSCYNKEIIERWVLPKKINLCGCITGYQLLSDLSYSSLVVKRTGRMFGRCVEKDTPNKG
jgi:hypothetical protein